MTPETLFVVCRFVHFLALMLLFGYGGFAVALSPVAIRDRLIAAGWRATALIAACMLLSAIAMIPLQSAQMGGGWADALDVADWLALRETAFGQVWQWHLIVALFTFLCSVAPFRAHAPRPNAIAYTALTVGAAALLGSLGLLGHAAMRQGALGVLQRANHALHLLSAAAWFGGLPPLLRCLRLLRDDRAARDAAVLALHRFSTMGHLAVAIVVLTGIANTLLIVGGWPVHVASPYQGLLVLKIAIVAVMIGIALVNRYHFVPSMRRDPVAACRALWAGTWAEILLGAGVLGLVSAFATLDPQGA